MTDTEATERDIITRDDAGRPQALATLPPGSMAQFLPKSVSELAVVAKFAAQARLFGVPDQVTALNIMLAGAHLGLTPYAALEGISLVKGRPVVSAQVQWTLILARGQVEEYTVDSDEKVCEITLRSRKWRESKTQRVTIDDVPKHLFHKTSSGADSNWTKFPADMLFAYCIRKLRKRYFPEVMVGAIDSGAMDSIDAEARVVPDATTVVDVGAVEEHLGPAAVETPPCSKVIMVDGDELMCGHVTELVPGRSGGMFLRCTEGHMMPPPQAVRDAIRGHRDGTAAIQQVAPSGPSDEEAKPEAPNTEGDNPADIIDAEVTPSDNNRDPGFMEAAGIAPEAAAHEEPKPQAMSREEADIAIQAILGHLTAARKIPERRAAAQTILHAHGYDDSPLTSWLMNHPEELPSLVGDLNVYEGALPL